MRTLHAWKLSTLFIFPFSCHHALYVSFFRGTTGAKVTGLWQCWCHSASRLSQCWQHTLWKLPANGCLSTAETCQPMSAQAKNLPTNDCWTLYLANYACQITGCSFFLLNWELMDFREFWMDGEFPAQFQGEKKKSFMLSHFQFPAISAQFLFPEHF